MQIQTYHLSAILVTLLAAGSGVAWQAKHPVSGRPIANVMSASGADWLERSERQSEENPAKAIEMIGLKPGMVVCDLGTGTGYYAVRMAAKVGPTGKVYGVDIQPKMIELLRAKLQASGVGNVEPVLSKPGDPKLPRGALDLVLMVDVYHEFSQPREMVRKIRESLKDDGHMVLLEYRKEDPSVPIRPEHKMSVDEVRMEVEADGFRVEKVLEDLPWQHMIFCGKR